MGSKHQAYPEYKESGEEWLGSVPTHWDVIQIKRLSTVKRGASPRPIDDSKYFDDEGEYAWTRIADVTASDVFLTQAPQKLSGLGSSLSVKLEPGSLFLSIAGTVGKPCITGMKACIHDGFVYFPELRMPNKFLFYVFAGEQAYKGLGKFGTQLNLNTDTVGGIKIGCTDNAELEKIVQFLDHETAKIDTLIEKQQQLIKLLKEKRQAVISHAVTKGLNPNAKMRESGVECIGDIPESWIMKSLSIASKRISVGLATSVTEYYRDEGVPIIRNMNIKEGYFDGSDMLYLDEKFATLQASKVVCKGDVIVVHTGSNVGLACVVPNKFDHCHTFTTLIVTTGKELLNRYLVYCINSEYGKAEVERLKFGFGKDNLNVKEFKCFYTLIPSYQEQIEIVSFLDHQIVKIDDLVKKAYEAINLIQERRTALISAAVTGKIDVRDWQPPNGYR